MLAKILNTTDFGGNVNFETAGSVGFHGGTGGAAYSNLVISGVPDKEWLEGLK